MAMEGMRAVLRSSLGRSLSAWNEVDRLAAAWPVACGRAMAEHGKVVAFSGNTVVVAVSDEVRLGQMIAMRSQLQAEMARVSGVRLSGMRFQLHLNESDNRSR